ncbi:MAG: serine protease [Ruminococcaceae bacterium]|nr:serine protease [Oscillospiraceae bacterium]
MKKGKILKLSVGIILILAYLVNLSACFMSVSATDYMEGVEAPTVHGRTADDRFIYASAAFAGELFKSVYSSDSGKNVLVSPLSVMLALAMATNGADGDTRAEMESMLGGSLTIEELNEYLYAYASNLPRSEKYRVDIANSIWYRDNKSAFLPSQDFLGINAGYYGAAAYGAPFNKSTVRDINNWVNLKTEGMIKKIIDSINEENLMYIINALVFEAEWQRIYERYQVNDGIFTTESGEEISVDMMSSSEHVYVKVNGAHGFAKQYKDSKYSFVTLLPDEGTSLASFIAGMDMRELSDAVRAEDYRTIVAKMPKFEYSYDVTLNDALAAMGMTDAFDPEKADFSAMGECSFGNLYIGEVLHKTHISVHEKGTKAGAVTSIGLNGSAAPNEIIYITLDRPFVYMIVDNQTGLPIFFGCLNYPEK